MTRRSSFLAGIFGALGFPALAQTIHISTFKTAEQLAAEGKNTGTSSWVHTDGPYQLDGNWYPPQWRLPVPDDAGKPKNNQCPVCGTMAEPYVRPYWLNAAFFQDAEK